MTAIVTRGDAANLQLPDETVDLIVTSPPYFGLRSYQDGGEHYDGQVGDEATPTEYLDALIACTAEWIRVLKPGGSIFVNLGDKYAGAPSGPRTPMGDGYIRDSEAEFTGPRRVKRHDVPTKSLIGLPWRYAIRCIDELGLILRAEIVWAKPNGLPESVTDRVRRSHEQVFHFVKQPRYYSAVDEVREEATTAPRYEHRASGRAVPGLPVQSNLGAGGSHLTAANYNPLGKLPGSVWTIPTAPLKVPASLGIDHFAAYPPELVRRIVLGWSPREVCTTCGEGRRPVAERASMRRHNGGKYEYERYSPDNKHGHGATTLGYVPDYRIAGYACACGSTGEDSTWKTHESLSGVQTAADGEPSLTVGGGASLALSASTPKTTGQRTHAAPPTAPGVVLDPFGGTGTSALVASAHGRVGISVDLSADYCRLARWRTTDPGERARVLGVDKPPVQVEGQIDLFGEWSA